MSLFDSFIFVDWSSSKVRSPASPSKDSVWVGQVHGTGESIAEYHRTRRSGVRSVRDILLRCVTEGKSVLLGFDFPYAYPSEFAGAIGKVNEAKPWLAIWQKISQLAVDDQNNLNHRFALAAQLNAEIGEVPGPFWGASKGEHRVLRSRKGYFEFPYRLSSGALLDEFRITEKRLTGTQSSWKLYGDGSVGSQALTGIPYLNELRFDPRLADHSTVWPMETGFSVPNTERRPLIVHSEIWPGVIAGNLDPSISIRDRAQVLAMCDWARRLDSSGELSCMFSEPPGLSDRERERCLREEGWILGSR